MFSFLASDKVGLKRFWLLSLLLQAILLLCLAVLTTVGKQNTWSHYLAIGILAAGTAVGATLKVSAGGLCYELYDHTQQVSALGLLVICCGMACIAGPLAIEKSYLAFGSYKQFLYGSAGISFIGLIALLLVRSTKGTHSSQSSEDIDHSFNEEAEAVQCQDDSIDATEPLL